MTAKSKTKSKRSKTNEPVIANRRARHDYFIDETLECGVKLTGTEIKSVRNGQVSLAEGYVRASDDPVSLTLYGVHIAEYAPAAEHHQHEPARPRTLLAHGREIRKLAVKTRAKGVTIVPLKMYFVRGKAKVLVGVARGKQKRDKRRDIEKRDMQRDMERARTTKR